MAEGQLKHLKGRAEGICWRYCQGLQIAGRPSYVRGSGIRPLPGTATWGDAPLQASLTGCLRQAVALCGESSQRCPTSRNLDKRTELAWARHCLPHHRVWQAENWAPATVLDMVRAAIHAGGLALLHFTPDHQASRWVLVTGVEQVWQAGVQEKQPGALPCPNHRGICTRWMAVFAAELGTQPCYVTPVRTGLTHRSTRCVLVRLYDEFASQLEGVRMQPKHPPTSTNTD